MLHASSPEWLIERFRLPHRMGGLCLSELHELSGLPGCFIEELLLNDFKPDTSWAKDLEVEVTGKQCIEASFPLPQQFPLDAKPYVCLAVTIQFLARGPKFHELGQVRLEDRCWPRISFIEAEGSLYEVTGGQVYVRGGHWRWKHFGLQNTELARHFRGVCGEPWPGGLKTYCIPCRQIEYLKTYGHGNYGLCQWCGKAFSLVPDQRIGPVIPPHKVWNRCRSQVRCNGSGEFFPKILEPKEAKAIGLGEW